MDGNSVCSIISGPNILRLRFFMFSKAENSSGGLRQEPPALLGGPPHGYHPPSMKKECLFVAVRPKSCGRRKRNQVGPVCRCGCEGHALRLCDAVFTPQMTVGFHCQRA